MNLQTLFDRFVKEKRYLLGVTAKTEAWYQSAWIAFKRTVGTPETLDRFVLNARIVISRLSKSTSDQTSENNSPLRIPVSSAQIKIGRR